METVSKTVRMIVHGQRALPLLTRTVVQTAMETALRTSATVGQSVTRISKMNLQPVPATITTAWPILQPANLL